MPDGSNFRLPQPEPETVRILKAAKARISDPANWLQNGYEDALGHVCAVGAIVKVSKHSTYAVEKLDVCRLQKAAREMGHENAADLNDFTDHPTVMRMFDRAIELAWQEHREKEHAN